MVFITGRIILLLLLGTALVLNPLFLYHTSGESRITYEVEEITNEATAEQALGKNPLVIECPSERPCALERQILTEGSVSYDGHLQQGQPYSVVRLERKLYQPLNSAENGTIRLELERISPREAVDRVAIPAETQRPDVRTAIETGSVTIYDERIEAFEQGQILEYNGSYYWSNGFQATDTHIHGIALQLVRTVLYATGIALIAYGGWTARIHVER